MAQVNNIIELSNPNYVPVMKASKIFYGGSQMWFSKDHKYSKDYVLHQYGCGTIATADFLLYLAMQNSSLKSIETEIAMKTDSNIINYDDYIVYVRKINDQYTKTKRVIAVLGTKIASAINSYSEFYDFGYKATWRLKLTYYDMLDIMEEMLYKDIPVILSIGPNTPKLWGKKGIPFYEYREIEYREISPNREPPSDGTDQIPVKKPYYYKAAQQNVNSHYITVTGIIKDEIAGRIMLRISSWGKEYYINYEEYWDYIDSASGTFTSSIVQVKKNV